MTVILLGCYRKSCWATHVHTYTHGCQALRPQCISSGEDLHSAPGRSTDKLLRQPRETEALAEGRDAVQRVSHPSDTLCGATPATHLTSRGTADVGRQARTFFWRPEGWMDLPSLGPGGARRPVSPPELAHGQQPWGYRSQIRPRFPNQRYQLGGNCPKVLLSGLNNSPLEMSSHKWTIH